MQMNMEIIIKGTDLNMILISFIKWVDHGVLNYLKIYIYLLIANCHKQSIFFRTKQFSVLLKIGGLIGWPGGKLSKLIWLVLNNF